MSKDEVRLREALKRIAIELELGEHWNVCIDTMYEVTPEIMLTRLPSIRQFALDMAEGGKRPGFDELIKDKLEAL
jgi:hypothetical protein